MLINFFSRFFRNLTYYVSELYVNMDSKQVLLHINIYCKIQNFHHRFKEGNLIEDPARNV